MSKLSNVRLRLLGTFAMEANLGRPIAISIRAAKARALLAYLSMKPDFRARREELAALLWGDNPESLARHSLRQCLISLRRDLCLASEILAVDRDTVGLRTELLAVDARGFAALARSDSADELAQAARLWRGAFLPDLVLDIEEFEAWRQREAERLAAAAAGVFETLCRNADARGDGKAAIAAAERLVALEPMHEDRQRTALKIFARYVGREATLSRASLLTDLLRNELDVGPEAATQTLIDAIKRGDFEQAPGQAEMRGVAGPATSPNATALTVAVTTMLPAAMAAVPTVMPAVRDAAPAPLRFWRRRLPITAAATGTLLAAVIIGAIAVQSLVTGWPLWPIASPRSPGIVVLPFAADAAGRSDEAGFAQALTHDLIGYLSRFGNLRVISEQTSGSYREIDVVRRLQADVGASYVVAGRVGSDENALRIDFQLIDTATRATLWSETVRREASGPAPIADEAARGIARGLAIQIDRIGALRVRTKPASQLTADELVARGYLALGRSITRENLSAAMTSFKAALQRNPHWQPALLGIARVQIVATTNFVDLDPPPDLDKAEQVLSEALTKSPNSISALYSLALLQKHNRQYQASLRSLQRCLELNPSFLPAQGQIGDVLVRLGEPEKGLEQILQTIRVAIPNDPTTGYWYLFAAEAELELGHDRAALDWALRANTFLPGSALVQAWLASIYATAGDKSSAAKYVALLTKMAPARTRLFLEQRPVDNGNGAADRRGPRILDGLRQALGSSLS